MAGEWYHMVYHGAYDIPTVSLRLVNTFGPRQLMKHARQGFIGWFIRQAIEDREIQIYGDGRQVRDFVYVDDAADAFLRAGATDASNGQVFNVGGTEPISHRELVALLISTAGRGRFRFVEWPPDQKAIDIGDFITDSSLIARTLGWRPVMPLREGLALTIAFYREHLAEYVPLSPEIGAL
jgi:UDP-glucose 4-epimerase